MTGLDRRALLGAALAGASGMLGEPKSFADEATPSLGAEAAASGFLFGTAFDIDTLEDARRTALLRRHARILTADHSMKWATIRPREDAVNFAPGDRLVDFASRSKIAMRGHNLIWNDWNPDWLSHLSKDRLIYWMDRHIDETVGRWAGRIQSWDVVNEPFWAGHHKPGGFRDGVWYGAMGPAYIERAFLRAGAADPHAKLSLNESGAEWAYAYGETRVDRVGVLRLIDRLRDAGARIDIVGLECHWMAANRFDAGLLTDFLGRLADKKVDVYVTELDVQDSMFPDDIESRDRAVAARYTEMLAVALAAPAVKSVQTWHLPDPESWLYPPGALGAPKTRSGRPLLFDAELRPKASFQAALDAFRTVREKRPARQP